MNSWREKMLKRHIRNSNKKPINLKNYKRVETIRGPESMSDDYQNRARKCKFGDISCEGGGGFTNGSVYTTAFDDFVNAIQ